MRGILLYDNDKRSSLACRYLEKHEQFQMVLLISLDSFSVTSPAVELFSRCEVAPLSMGLDSL